MKALRYGSVCSGIEAASVAWEPLGWTPAWFCEIDPFASAVLAHRFPKVKNHGDFTHLLDPGHPVHDDPIDVLVGGTPCQDFSIAGLRAGIEGSRGSLTLDFCRLVGLLRPKWVVWENVPGVLSSNGGRALGAFLGALGELGYGFAWRVLDAQYFGLAQRRKRVFVVACAGAQSSRAAAVLLEPEGMLRNPPARREAREKAATNAGESAASGGLREAFSFQTRIGRNGRGQPEPIIPALNGANAGATSDMRPCIVQPAGQSTHGIVNVEHGLNTSGNLEIRSVSEPITASERKGHSVVIQRKEAVGFDVQNMALTGPITGTILSEAQRKAGQTGQAVLTGHLAGYNDVTDHEVMVVRRLTPRECERLQGFPDDWTLIPHRGGTSSDSNRYRALGNSMAVPVMRWIGARIAKMNERS